METTDFLILHKKLYSESSLIIAGLSPTRGKLQFIARGGRRYGRNKFPQIDVFRHFQVHFRVARSELYNWRDADMVNDFAALARSSAAYQSGCWLARFILDNSFSENAAPRLFRALIAAFSRLRDNPSLEHGGESEQARAQRAMAITGTMLIFLQENGWLLENLDSIGPECRDIIEIAEKPRYLPEMNLERWRRVYQRIVRILCEENCVVPK